MLRCATRQLLMLRKWELDRLPDGRVFHIEKPWYWRRTFFRFLWWGMYRNAGVIFYFARNEHMNDIWMISCTWLIWSCEWHPICSISLTHRFFLWFFLKPTQKVQQKTNGAPNRRFHHFFVGTIWKKNRSKHFLPFQHVAYSPSPREFLGPVSPWNSSLPNQMCGCKKVPFHWWQPEIRQKTHHLRWDKHEKTRWWFQRFPMFTPIPGEMIQFWLIFNFSIGLKAPTR